ncbi:ion channel [Solwaraspora sp. WMMD791]|uniref:potassium channel family protein n=1 Tax=Solwaraspora sp. WMMD791 TaxID=3016086 RepID=UPI00249BBF86|nr:potassium channel family protein [Solwaraspora sp. WMMD791]WFE27786.1 ion channel [Solwaraspora sp. WMMD791]
MTRVPRRTPTTCGDNYSMSENSGTPDAPSATAEPSGTEPSGTERSTADPSQAEQRRRRAEVWHTILICLLMVALYYLVPIEPDVSGVHRVIRAVITTVGVVLVATMVLLQIRRQITVDPSDVRLARLAITLVGGVIAFALADLVISFSDPGQFVNMTTKTDALYFAIGTLTTVGYGDVHANGQLARAAVCVQMLFSVGVLATGASLLVKRWIERAGRQPAAR